MPRPCHGDALTVEHIIDAKEARATGHTKLERLLGVEPVPQEFHKRAVMLQDTLNLLSDAHSSIERGTLFNIKHVFNHRCEHTSSVLVYHCELESNLKKHVMGNFNHVDDVVQFVTESMICYLALQLCDLHCLDEPLTMDVRNLVKKIVSEVWLQVCIMHKK